MPSSPLVTTVIFQNCQALKQNYYVVLAFAAMLFFETMPLWSCMVGLIQLPNFYEGDLLSGSWTLWVSMVDGVKGFLQGPWLQRSNDSKVLTISRVWGFQGPRVNGSQGLIGFNGYQRSTGFRVSRDSGFPMLSRAFKGAGISIIQMFQGSRDGGFQGFKVQGLEGERAPKFS